MLATQKIIDAINDSSFIRLILSPPRTLLRKIEGKKTPLYQLTETKGSQEFHRNLNGAEAIDWLQKITQSYKQAQLFCSEADYHLFFPSKIIKNEPTGKKIISHNREKNHVLAKALPPPYLKALNIKHDKWVQIERFLQEIKAILPTFDGMKKITVVDFGCGKAYLTFALYDFLSEHFEVEMQGIDLKKEVLESCQKLANELNYTGLKFIHGAIDSITVAKADLVVALHACDTATDAAIEKGVLLNAKVLLIAPCCQHELYNQIKNEELNPLLKHGILRERFAALATDAARGLLLEQMGYDVRIVEFIDAVHTPKNLLIRAVFTDKMKDASHFSNFKKLLQITPNLETRLL